ncbi:hypothetical protein EKL30_09800 [Candidimonas sp. SYP-B2681]|uniref:hypothetical protein n=1 Tax=Candidimonas sp. SYP-B2681 TaxID=2497686 RepID=UPI000F87B1F9|nr:hypothetical protein [Candidimonas sp. SYP-B2681]RTZ43169.1 hypothetical protein EKL30_09800 [Candidimonas sp. SYP-B2681]
MVLHKSDWKSGAPKGRSQGILDRLAGAWLLVLGLLVFFSTIYGVVHYFSPLPYSDQWIGSIGFLQQLADGNTAAWWVPHMEHRIVLARVFFWLDANWFGGRNVFLFVAAVLLQSLTAMVFITQAAQGRRRGSIFLIAGLCLVLLFSWIQYENFTWGFQSQFIAVYLFALMASAVFSRGINDGRPRMPALYWSIVPAVLATVSMGNGLLVFPLLVFQSLLLRRPLKELAVPLIAGAVVGLVYFTGFTKPDIGLPSVPLADALWLVPHFFLSFMGSATYFLIQDFTVSALFGLFSLVAMLAMTFSLYRHRKVTPYRSFLIAGYAFIAIAALAAATGRYPLGLGQAVVSRYGTPMLISWACLFLLAYDVAVKAALRRAVVLVAVGLATWVATYQHNVNNDAPELFRRDLAVLSIKAGIDRPDLTSAVFFADQRNYLMEQARFAAEINFGPYGSGWLHDAGVVKFDPARVDPAMCTGSYDMLRRLPEGMDAAGWVVLKRPTADRVLILLVDGANATVGYGVSGAIRDDVNAYSGVGRYRGWMGLIKAGASPAKAYAYDQGKFCELPRGPGVSLD